MKTRMVRCTALIASVFAFGVANAATEWSTQDYDLYPGDFDGDGKTDMLYVAKDAGKASGIARSDGAGPNLPWQSWPSNYLGIQWYGGLYTPIVADFNGDGRSDVFLQRSTPGDHYLLHADANGKFSDIAQTLPNSVFGVVWSADQHKVHVGDFNGGGKASFFLQATSPSGTNYVVLTNGFGKIPREYDPGASQPPGWTDASWSAFKWSTKHSNIYVGNFDGDADADLLVQAKPNIVLIDYEIPIPIPTYPPNAFGVAFSAGASLFTGSVQQWNKNSHGVDWAPNATNIVVGNFDGTGGSDVMLQVRNAGRLSFMLSGQGSGYVFGNPTSSPATTLANNVTWSADSYRVIVGNFDGVGAAGVYFQAVTSGGSNFYTNSVTGAPSLSSHPNGGGTAPADVAARTPGSASVGVAGDARYTIPLWTPPGVNGLQPSMSLEFSSRTGNAWMGVGWSMPIFSVISRCPLNAAQDSNGGYDYNKAISSWDVVSKLSSNKLCLDGNRLRLDGAGTYGAAGTTYRTEIESFRKITIAGADGNGPTSFKVQSPDGLTYEYGSTSNSQIRLLTTTNQLSSVRLYWALTRVRDSSGNTIEFTYEQDMVHGGYYPTQIEWGGAYKIVFTNEAAERLDPVVNEIPYKGLGVSRYFNYFRRLGHIDVISAASNALLRRYKFTYAPWPNSGYSRSVLQSIQECGIGLACAAPTTFNWVTPAVTQTNQDIQRATSTTLTVVDINGDSRDDLVWPAGTWQYMLSNAAGGFGPTVPTTVSVGSFGAHVINWNNDKVDDLVVDVGGTWRVMPGVSGGTGFGPSVNTGIAADVAAFVDVNHDGLDDLVQRNGSGLALHYGGNGVFLPAPQVQPGWGVAHVVPAYGKRRQDFNADGYEDVLYTWMEPDPDWGIYTEIAQIAYGSATGLQTPIDGSYNNVSYAPFLGDFNRDGRTDYVLGSEAIFNSGYPQRVQIPLMNTTSPRPVVVADWDLDGRDDVLAATSPSGTSWVLHQAYMEDVGANGFYDPQPSPVVGAAAVTGDFDGDGFDDVLSTTGSSLRIYRRVSSGYWAASETLVSVADGFGVTAKFTYGTLADPAIQPIPGAANGTFIPADSSMMVVRTLTSSDGTGTSATYDTKFVYEGGQVDTSGRGFVGFSKRTITDTRSPTLKVEETYRKDFPFIGAITTSVLKRSTGEPIRSQTNTWAELQYNAGTSNSRAYPYVSQQVEENYELTGGNFATATTTVTAIDSISGLVTDQKTITTEQGTTGLTPGATHTQRTYISAFTNDTTSWCLGRPTRLQQINSHSLTGGISTTRTTDLAWNFVKCRPDSETTEPDDTDWRVATSYSYDGFGNIDTITVTPAAEQGQAARTTKINWTYYAGLFPRTVENAKGQVTTFDWNTAKAVRTGVIDPNAVTTNWSYDDPLGRLTRATHSDGTKTDLSYTWCSSLACRMGDANRRMYATAVERDATVSSAEISRSYHYIDQFDREIMTQTQVLGGGYSTQRRAFDARGLLWQESTPFLASDSVWYTTYSYDVLGRRLQVTRPVKEGDSSAQSFTRSYSGLTVTTTNARTNTTTYKLNSLGQVVQSIDALSKDTDYEYNAFGELLKTRDFAGNEISVEYYPNGLKKKSTDPDMGVWEYDYYPLGELKWQKDAKSQETQFQYDVLSRSTKRTEPEGDTIWTWDDPTDGSGRLSKVTSPGGYMEEYDYDPKGRLSQTIVTAGTGGGSFTTNQAYNDAGRLSVLTYPQSTGPSRFAVQYTYQYGMVQRINEATAGVGAMLWQANAVNARGQIIDEQMSNTLRTISGYDRIAGSLDYRMAGPNGGAQRQNLAYQYDKMGNLTQRRDLNQNLREDFSYDELDRLDKAWLNGGATPAMDLDYNDIGNIKKKTDVSATDYDYVTQQAGCSYGAFTHAQPHAVRKAGAASYCYDANGNMILRGGASITWSSFNLPTQINGSGSTSSQFLYGADRSRYKHVATFADGSTETTVSILGIFDKVKFGSAPDEYRHTVVGPEGPIMVRTRRTAGMQEEDSFISTDHLGSASLITNAAANIVVQLSYDAFGKRRDAATWSGSPAAQTVPGRGFEGLLTDSRSVV